MDSSTFQTTILTWIGILTIVTPMVIKYIFNTLKQIKEEQKILNDKHEENAKKIETNEERLDVHREIIADLSSSGKENSTNGTT